MNHDVADLGDVADGDQVVAGVDPPTSAELRAAARLTPDETVVAIEAHVEAVNIHDGRDR